MPLATISGHWRCDRNLFGGRMFVVGEDGASGIRRTSICARSGFFDSCDDLGLGQRALSLSHSGSARELNRGAAANIRGEEGFSDAE